MVATWLYRMHDFCWCIYLQELFLSSVSRLVPQQYVVEWIRRHVTQGRSAVESVMSLQACCLIPPSCEVSQLVRLASAHDAVSQQPYCTLVNMCHECMRCLQRKQVPYASLARVDPGCIPKALNADCQLLQPTMIEETLLTLLRPAVTHSSFGLMIPSSHPAFISSPCPDMWSLFQTHHRQH